MRKIIYQKMYDCLSILSGRFNNRLLIKIKIAMGAALIILTSSCSKESDEPESTCYARIPDDSVKVQSLQTPDTSIEITEVDDQTEM